MMRLFHAGSTTTRKAQGGLDTPDQDDPEMAAAERAQLFIEKAGAAALIERLVFGVRFEQTKKILKSAIEALS